MSNSEFKGMENDWIEIQFRSPNEGITLQFGKKKGNPNHIDITSKSIGYGHSSQISHFLKEDDIKKLREFLIIIYRYNVGYLNNSFLKDNYGNFIINYIHSSKRIDYVCNYV
jgi:hypothetical protein